MTESKGGRGPVAYAALCVCLHAAQAWAAEGQLPETTVKAQSVSAEALDPAHTPYATETLSREQMERQQVLDIRDATRDMVNVDVPRQPRRGTGISGTTGREGNTGFEIRGLGGNRVQMLVDGIPQPEADSFQNSHSFGRDYVDPLTLAGIDVHKGVSPVDMPAGGIAGAVNLRTLSPADLLRGDQSFAGRALVGWRSESQGLSLGAALAGRPSEQWQWLISVNGDRSDEVKTMGDVGGTGLKRTEANPQDVRRRSALGKLVFKPNAEQSHVLTAEYRSQKTFTDNLHDFANGTTLSHTDNEDSTRQRLSLKSDFRLHAAAADLLSTYVGWQDSDSQQMLRIDTSTQGLRVRDHAYGERVLLGGVKARKQLGAHALYYGLDWSRTDYATQSLSTDRGVTTFVPKGPDTRTTRWGAFVQDSLELGAFTLVPGLRYESVDIAADASSIDMGNSGAQAVSRRFSAWMPQLGAQMPIGPEGSGMKLFANYARGFRAPTAGELNNFFGNITPYYGYYILPNPNLKAETSNNLDLGLRGAQGAFQWEAAAFYGRYQNFIERYANAGSVGSNPVVTLQQSRNQARATLKGLELKGQSTLGKQWGGEWQLRGGYGYTKGTGENGEGLESVSPHQLKLGLGQKAARWNWELAVTHTGGKKASDLPANTPSLFLSPSSTVLDLTAQMELRRGLRLNMGLFNLTDQKYWNWTDVRGVTQAAERAAIDAYSLPGRNLRVSLVADF
jgi:hemoglobin/transferrin/lactoferrin receptor protein